MAKKKAKIIFDVNNPNPVTRFLFDGENEENGWVDLRQIQPKAMNKIIKQTERKTVVFKKRKKVDDVIVDEELRTSLFWDAGIVDWFVPVADGVVFECNIENKTKMIEENQNFLLFLNESLEELTGSELDSQEEREKN